MCKKLSFELFYCVKGPADAVKKNLQISLLFQGLKAWIRFRNILLHTKSCPAAPDGKQKAPWNAYASSKRPTLFRSNAVSLASHTHGQPSLRKKSSCFLPPCATEICSKRSQKTGSVCVGVKEEIANAVQWAEKKTLVNAFWKFRGYIFFSFHITQSRLTESKLNSGVSTRTPLRNQSKKFSICNLQPWDCKSHRLQNTWLDLGK